MDAAVPRPWPILARGAILRAPSSRNAQSRVSRSRDSRSLPPANRGGGTARPGVGAGQRDRADLARFRDASVTSCAKAMRFHRVPSPGWWVGGGPPLVAARRRVTAARREGAPGSHTKDGLPETVRAAGAAARRLGSAPKQVAGRRPHTTARGPPVTAAEPTQRPAAAAAAARRTQTRPPGWALQLGNHDKLRPGAVRLPLPRGRNVVQRDTLEVEADVAR